MNIYSCSYCENAASLERQGGCEMYGVCRAGRSPAEIPRCFSRAEGAPLPEDVRALMSPDPESRPRDLTRALLLDAMKKRRLGGDAV